MTRPGRQPKQASMAQQHQHQHHRVPKPPDLPHHLGSFSKEEVEALSKSTGPRLMYSSFQLVRTPGFGTLWLEQPRLTALDQRQLAGPTPPPPLPADAVYDPQLLCELMDLKAAFESMPRSRFSAARGEANPFEGLVGASPFLNRSALKLANLNHVVGVTSDMRLLPKEFFTFVDLCGGPGGFSQYVLAVHEAKGRVARGWGITLEEDDCPWDREALGRWIEEDGEEDRGRKRALSLSSASSSSSSDGEASGAGAKRQRRVRAPLSTRKGGDEENEVHREQERHTHEQPAHRQHHQQPQQQRRQQSLRLCYGADGTGDLCRLDNIRHFARQVHEGLRQAGALHECSPGVTVVMADGGFAAARSRFDQEARMLPLIIAEVLAMAYALREGGCFVCKLFETTLRGSVQVLAVLALMFDCIGLIKPVTSRPASSERYVVCTYRRDGPIPLEEGEAGKDGAAADPLGTLLRGMLARALAGHTDGYALEGERDGDGGNSSSPSSDEDVATRVRQVMRGDTAFLAWLRAVNDRHMRGQVAACQAILEALERQAEDRFADAEDEEEGAEREQKQQHEGQDVGVDAAAYMRAWGIEGLGGGKAEGKKSAPTCTSDIVCT